MTSDKIEILIPEVKIQNRVRELATRINNDYAGKELTVICVLKGSFVFMSDLIRYVDVPLSCEFLGLSSYGNEQQSSGQVKVTLDLHDSIEGKHVLVIEDIVDTGTTLEFLRQNLLNRKPASLKVCSLLLKPEKLKVPLNVEYIGFEIGNEFVIGYGVDYAEKFRGLPYIGFMKNEH